MKPFFNYTGQRIQLKRYTREDPDTQTILMGQRLGLFSFSEDVVRKHCENHRLLVMDVDELQLFPIEHVNDTYLETFEGEYK